MSLPPSSVLAMLLSFEGMKLSHDTLKVPDAAAIVAAAAPASRRERVSVASIAGWEWKVSLDGVLAPLQPEDASSCALGGAAIEAESARARHLPSVWQGSCEAARVPRPLVCSADGYPSARVPRSLRSLPTCPPATAVARRASACSPFVIQRCLTSTSPSRTRQKHKRPKSRGMKYFNTMTLVVTEASTVRRSRKQWRVSV